MMKVLLSWGLCSQRGQLLVNEKREERKINKQESIVSAVRRLSKPCRGRGEQGSNKGSHEAGTRGQGEEAIRKVGMSILIV